ncbi:class I SAM-dependent methyltransferase [Subsaxibacter sp. CAU 1640]|uniref:O-methyltransferase n=1 Tax=Subsaxibacter sp. CAU 1640 TaxID=2933271 RepID=UPI002004FE1C|nr:class I SAM-dependent methyltransferase [Subsaxibacter sp. CAU 1640]MCK7589915.1 class I SAM-dependent methyltransferase [Subsaxibacter sp. CAU 1640]
MFQIIEYIKFLWHSKNEHAVHSPFVFDLITKCFYDRTFYPEYNQLHSYRKSLLSDSQIIEIKDFGSGSKVFSSNKRQIKDIAKTSGTSHKRSKLLFRLTRYLNVNNAIELGTSLGIGTYSMALGNQNASIISIEGCPEISRFTSDKFKKLNINNVQIVNDVFSSALQDFKHNKFDLVFIDGHHDKDATIEYFQQLLPNAHNDSVFIFDDIHWSKGMTEAWNSIKNHPQVTVTIDTFFWGFVFFRTEQAKEHFTIRV